MNKVTSIEEAADKYANKEWPYWKNTNFFVNCQNDFIAGAKWMQQKYQNEIILYESKIKAADEVIKLINVFQADTPSQFLTIPTVLITEDKEMIKALEHYKSLNL